LIAIERWFHPTFLFSEIHFSHISIIIHELLNLIPYLDTSKFRENKNSGIDINQILIARKGKASEIRYTFWTLRVKATSLLFNRRTRSKFNVLILDVSSSSNGYASISNSAAFRKLQFK
jgi:hypothetical protein